MTPDTLLAALRDTDVMLPLACSVVAGALIGVEREFQRKPAGLRTHTLVCLASALMTLLGLRMAEWTVGLPPDAQIVTDMARMPHAILTGIGFLGAGVIFREGASVQGLTTAASLWLTAALGIVFGAGLLELGVIGTAMALGVLVVLRALQRLTPPKPMIRLEVAARAESGFDAARLEALLSDHRLRPGPLSIRHEHDTGLRHYTTLVSAQRFGIDGDALARMLRAETGVEGYSITPLENEVAGGG